MYIVHSFIFIYFSQTKQKTISSLTFYISVIIVQNLHCYRKEIDTSNNEWYGKTNTVSCPVLIRNFCIVE